MCSFKPRLHAGTNLQSSLSILHSPTLETTSRYSVNQRRTYSHTPRWIFPLRLIVITYLIFPSHEKSQTMCLPWLFDLPGRTNSLKLMGVNLLTFSKSPDLLCRYSKLGYYPWDASKCSQGRRCKAATV